MMWSTENKIIRSAIWKNNWSFFKKSMGHFSYTQLAYSIFNIFRYFIDIINVLDWEKNHKDGVSDEIIFKEIKERLLTDNIKRINDAIDIMKFEWNWERIENENDFHYTKRFVNSLWNTFLKALITKYIEYRKEDHKPIYEQIEKFMKSKLFKCFGILHNVAFIHFIPKDNRKKSIFRNKDLFVLTILNALLLATKNNIEFIKNNNLKNVNISLDYINKFININYPDKVTEYDNNNWENFLCDKLNALWPLLDLLLELIDLIKLKGKSDNDSILNKIFEEKDRIAFFVDGSFDGKSAGWGYAAYDYNNREICHASGSIPKNLIYLKNVAGELGAAVNAATRAYNMNLKKISICHDYIGIYSYFNNDWIPGDSFIKEYVLNMKKYAKSIDIKFVKVPSHTGILGNDMADYYAKLGAGIKQNNKENDIKYSAEQINLYKELYKFIFKYLTIAENIYLNANLNDLDLNYLLLNLNIKYFNLEEFANKQFRLSEIDSLLDPIDDNFFDLFE